MKNEIPVDQGFLSKGSRAKGIRAPSRCDYPGLEDFLKEVELEKSLKGEKLLTKEDAWWGFSRRAD